MLRLPQCHHDLPTMVRELKFKFKFEEEEISQEEEEDDSGYDEDKSDDDDERDGSECSVDSEENQDEESYRSRRKEKAKLVVTDFLRRVEENQFDDFNWPPDRESPTFKLGWIRPYTRKIKFLFESEKNPDEDHCTATKFLDQVRKTWGYGVDCFPPLWLYSPFSPLDIEEDDELFGVKESADFAVKRINEQAVPEKDMKFELVRIERAVKTPSTVLLLTLSIKETRSDAEEKIIRVAVSNQFSCGPEILECKLIPSLSSSSSDSPGSDSWMMPV